MSRKRSNRTDATRWPRRLILMVLAGWAAFALGNWIWRKPASAPAATTGTPFIRVRLLVGVDRVAMFCRSAPNVQVGTGPTLMLDVPPNAGFNLTLSARGWQAGEANLGGVGASAVLHLIPGSDGSVLVNGVAYRGRFRCFPVGSGKFDVINELDIDSYLNSVVSREMLSGWHDEAFKAQAIVARTYALYEKQTNGERRHWDVYADTRSQVYGGMPAETHASRSAVAQTAGVVAAYPDQDARPRIFKAYFSSVCGGVTQSAADAFGEPFIPPLADQNAQAACRNAPRFNWGPVEIRKDDLGTRIKNFAQRRGRVEKDMSALARIDVLQTNRWGRPVRFMLTDVRQNRFAMSAEEFRVAVNWGAGEGPTIYSSYVKVINDSDRIRFVEGRGWGHGVGMCQWCAQARAEVGLRHEDIIVAAYPTAVLVRAY